MQSHFVGPPFQGQVLAMKGWHISREPWLIQCSLLGYISPCSESRFEAKIGVCLRAVEADLWNDVG